MNDFHHRAFGQLRADNQNQRRHHQTGEVFIAGVAVGMLGVGGLLSHAEPQQRYNGRGRVGKVVHCVGNDGNGTCNPAHHQFPQK